MESQPFFSIIIATFNSGGTLAIALDSITKQTFTEFEVLIIDGGSTDNTIEIIKQFAVSDKKITWVSEEDSGVYDAMNKGIVMALGKWLYFLGSDDYLFNEDVLMQVSAFTVAHPHANYFYGNVTSSYLGKKYDGLFDEMKITRKNICHQAIFYNKNLFSFLGNYKLKYKVNSDWEFNIRCFFNRKVHPEYMDMIVAYFSGGGLSNTVEDPVFLAERSFIVAHNGYHSIPLKELKVFCKTNFEYLQLLIKRVLYHAKNWALNINYFQ